MPIPTKKTVTKVTKKKPKKPSDSGSSSNKGLKPKGSGKKKTL